MGTDHLNRNGTVPLNRKGTVPGPPGFGRGAPWPATAGPGDPGRVGTWHPQRAPSGVASVSAAPS